MRYFSRLLRMIRPYTRWVALSVLLGSATTASSIGLMGSSSYLITMAALQPSIAVLQVAIVGVRFFGIARGVFRYLERLATHDVTFRLLADLRVAFYQGLERITPEGSNDISMGDLQSRAIADIDVLQNFYVRVVAPPITALTVTIGVGLFTGTFVPVFGVLIGGGLLVSGILISWLAYRLSARMRGNVLSARGDLNAQIISMIQGSQELISLQADALYLNQANQASVLYNNKQMQFNSVSAFVNSLQTFSSNFTMWLVLIIGIPLVSMHQISSINLAVLALISLASFEVITPLGQAAQYLENSLKAAQRLFEIVDATPKIHEPANPPEVSSQPDITLDKITFSYPSDPTPVLEDFSLHLPYGKRVALVGPSGAGKTSVLRVLERFYEVEKGSYLVQNCPAQEFSAGDIRSKMSVCSADPYIFQNTVLENMRLAKKNASEVEIMYAFEQVSLSDWVKRLPEGLNSWIGSQGHQMSGGELQRFGIARSILHDSPIWLLDEPAANLDASLEQEIITLLEKVTRGKSLVWITHHLTRLDFMDEIIFMENGKIRERGKEAELLSRESYYKGWIRI